MATVTSYTANRMKEIEDTTIVDGDVVAGELILTRRDGITINAGDVVGPQGNPGPQGDPGADASFAGYTEPRVDLGTTSGVVTLDFGVANVWRINPNGAVTIQFANLPPVGEVASGTLIIENSAYAFTWPAGTQFANGVAPILNGKTIISMFAYSTTMMLGTAMVGVA